LGVCRQTPFCFSEQVARWVSLTGDDSSTIQGKLTENYKHQNEDENVRQQFISLSVLIEFM
jgi:hypothetical protein